MIYLSVNQPLRLLRSPEAITNQKMNKGRIHPRFLRLDHPYVSAQILLQWGFPEEVVFVVAHHHGSAVCQDKIGKNVADNLNGFDLRYLGQAPPTPMAALLMIADKIEATLNGSLYGNELTSTEIEEKITLTISEVMRSLRREKQLVNSGLTFHDLEEVETAFKNELLRLHSLPRLA
ncbi:hypothetical protein COT42_00095 [Candidatus Saganbacteria bacterium CG08_land_8_20_14_0_20_45_16]|uniref:HD domain-containing protein n=1 Tax=Candidatus Saganbacteria bacterium CG08_land_8_20_14_0_20_45_16 TaxID=2014293 RepID=A0A2H0Y447_UNCSA|nr:MAG: hypothetical protein COT42_00095 [Candidatus Saganbacteria bacterium CG08_land_8_20_14_0_20_45_16]